MRFYSVYFTATSPIPNRLRNARGNIAFILLNEQESITTAFSVSHNLYQLDFVMERGTSDFSLIPYIGQWHRSW